MRWRFSVSGRPVELSYVQFRLMEHLLREPERVHTRAELLSSVWRRGPGDTRTVDVHVRQLRRKIGDTCPIVTVWGVGYKVADDASAVS